MARSTVICCGTAEKDEQQFQAVVADTFRLVQQISTQLQPGAKTIKALDFYSKIVVAPYANSIKFAMQWIRDSTKQACIDMTLRTSTSPALSIEQCQEIAQNEDWVPTFTEEPEKGERLLVFIPEAEDLLSSFSGLLDSVKIFSVSRVADEEQTQIKKAFETFEYVKELENSLAKEKQKNVALQTELTELYLRIQVSSQLLQVLQTEKQKTEERCAILEKERKSLSELSDFEAKKLAEDNVAVSQMCEFQTIKIIELRKRLRTTVKEVTDANQKCAMFETRLRNWGIVGDPLITVQEQIPDFFTSESRAALERFGSYEGKDEEPLLIKLGPVYDQDAVYIGQWNGRNLPHGYGEMVWNDGSVYDGQWRDGWRTGKGRYIHASGEVYIGDFVQGYKNGFGIMYFADGSMYSGTWVNDKKQGIGAFKCGELAQTPGDYYIGEFVDDLRSGPGAYFHSDGGFSMGFQLLNKLHGKGLMASPNGELYFGEYADGRMSGFGSFLWTNNDVYRGEWRQDMINGLGTLTHPGEFYQGAWAFSLRHGEGVCRLQDGSVGTCLFANGQFQKVVPNLS